MGRAKKVIKPFDFACPITPDQWSRVVQQLDLPPQQAKIVKLVLCGMRDKQIASELGVGFATVRTYLSRVFERVGVRDRVELILRVISAAHSMDCRQHD